MSGFIHVHSMYSLHDSTQTPDEIVMRTKELGYKNVTLTDHGTLLGIEPFMDAGKKYDINTIPGVETYLKNRNHLLIVAKNYKGYVSISHAMRDANTNIEELKKLKYPIMSDDVLEKHFKDNDDVFATSACIQGPIGYILLENYRRKKKVVKEEKTISLCSADYKEWESFDKKYKEIAEQIRELKKNKTANSKFLKPAYLKKIEELKNQFSGLTENDSNYEKIKNSLEYAEDNYKIAKDTVESLEIDIALYEKNKVEIKSKRDSLSNSKNKYLRAKERIDAINYVNEDVLYEKAKEKLLYLKSIFKQFYIELQYHGLEQEAYVMPILVKLAKETNTPIIAANDAHMKDNSEESIEARRIVRFNYFERAQEVSEVDKTMYLKTNEELIESLSSVIDSELAKKAVENISILDECKVVFPNEKHYPVSKSKETFDELLEIKRNEMINNGEWNEEYENRLKHEVNIIKTMGYVDYHMIVRDFCNEGRCLGVIPKDRMKDMPESFNDMHEWIKKNNFSEGIGIGPGRGSAAGSLVCYMLGITNINPIKYNLFFERFLNPERVSMPDIDTDVRTSLRPVIIRYIKWKYGEDAVCSIATETTYGARGAVQMVGRDRASQLYKNEKNEKELKKRYMYDKTLVLSDMIPDTPGTTLSSVENQILKKISDNAELVLLWERAKLIEGKLSGTGVHAGGIIISDNDNVNDYIPVAWNEDKGVWAAQCDMNKAEEKGLLKMDLLGVGTLDCISDCVHLIKKYHGLSIDIDKIPFEEEVFSEIYAKGNTNSVFQVESDGMKSMLKSFKPTCFEDIILLIACYRPGPMKYLDNIIEVKNGRKSVSYKTPELESILSMTYGATVYQEQVMQIFQKLAGYSLGNADMVRRAMSKKKLDKIEIERSPFLYGDPERNIDGCVKRGIKEDIANELFDEMIDFAKYAFNKSHAAAYAVVSYQTAWLKYHYPAEFLCSMFNNKEQDAFSPIIDDCKLYNIKLLPPDINHSYYEFVLEDNNIRYGIGGIKGIGNKNESYINNISENRKDGMYLSVNDFLKRNIIKNDDSFSLPGKKITEAFINAGLFDCMGYNRESLLYRVTELSNIELKGDYNIVSELIDNFKIEKGEKNVAYNAINDMQYLGTILSEHPLDKYAEDKLYSCMPVNQLSECDGEKVSIFGFIVLAEKKKSKNNNDLIRLELQCKTGSCVVYVMGSLYKLYENNIDGIKHHVVKIYGTCKSGQIFALRMNLMPPNLQEYFIDLKSMEDTEFLMKLLKENSEQRNIPVKINCHWLINNGEYYKAKRPKVCEVKMTENEVIYVRKSGIAIQEWK